LTHSGALNFKRHFITKGKKARKPIFFKKIKKSIDTLSRS